MAKFLSSIGQIDVSSKKKEKIFKKKRKNKKKKKKKKKKKNRFENAGDVKRFWNLLSTFP